MLFVCTVLYVTATTGLGMVLSNVSPAAGGRGVRDRGRDITPTLQFSAPPARLDAPGECPGHGSIWPATYYMALQPRLAYTKGLGRPHDGGHPVPRGLHPGAAGHQLVRAAQSRSDEHGIAEEHLLARGSGDRSLLSDKVMVFSSSMRSPSQSGAGDRDLERIPERVACFVDEDPVGAPKEIFNAFYPARFQFPEYIRRQRRAGRMDRGLLHVRRLDPAAVRA